MEETVRRDWAETIGPNLLFDFDHLRSSSIEHGLENLFLPGV